MQIELRHSPVSVRHDSFVDPRVHLPVHLQAVTTAVPGNAVTQAEVAAASKRIFDGRNSEIERLLPVFVHAGIDSRHLCMPMDWYLSPHSWEERNSLFVEHAVDLLCQVAERAIAEADCNIGDIDGLVVVSTTGVATPSLDALVMERLGMRRDVRRMPLFGLGCVGGVIGLSRACDLLNSRARGKTLLLVVELCSLTFRRNDQSNGNIVAAALFGDGAAGVVLGHDGDGPALLGAGSHTWSHSLDVMGWKVENDGFGVLFSRDIPTLIRREYREPLEAFLRSQDMTFADLSGFVLHPGGAKVIEALEQSIGLPPRTLAVERRILQRYGNMSAVTVLFVLKDVLAAGMRGLYLMSALGPGFTAGFQLLSSL